MKSYKEYRTELKERALHRMFRSIDLKLAKSNHKNLIDNQVIDKRHKFGDIIIQKDIDTYFSHSDEFSHNYRVDIESYNEIITRNVTKMDKLK